MIITENMIFGDITFLYTNNDFHDKFDSLVPRAQKATTDPDGARQSTTVLRQ